MSALRVERAGDVLPLATRIARSIRPGDFLVFDERDEPQTDPKGTRGEAQADLRDLLVESTT